MNKEKIVVINDGCIKTITLYESYTGDTAIVRDDEIVLAHGGDAVIELFNGKKLKVQVSDGGWLKYDN